MEAGMARQSFPAEIGNWIGGQEIACSVEFFEKRNPADGTILSRVVRSRAQDVLLAVEAANAAQPAWADVPPVRRGEILLDVALALKDRREEVARVVAAETGKSYKDALGESNGAIALGIFMAGEGQRLYGRTTTSGV